MDRETQKYIIYVAQKVIERYDIRVPITNIEEIVSRMGGTITEKDALDIYCGGTIKKSDSDNFEIAISVGQSPERKNFIIAQELGHLFLHMGFQTDDSVWNKQKILEYRRFGTTEQEHQANEFAAALLMPSEEFKESLYANLNNSKVDIYAVANHFKVSQSVAINRGRSLGYFK